MKEILQESWAIFQTYAQKQLPMPVDVIHGFKHSMMAFIEQGKKEWATAIPTGGLRQRTSKRVKLRI